MYWTRQHLKLVPLLFSLVWMMGCAKSDDSARSSGVDPLPTATGSPLPKQKCFEGVKAAANCNVLEKASYRDSLAFNGRTQMGGNIEGANGERVINVPKGFYKHKLITIKDLDNVAANIARGTSIFGTSGDLDGAIIPDCAPSISNSGAENPSTCRLTPSNQFAYQSAYGGRGQVCSIANSGTEGLSFNGRCWFDNTEQYFIYNQRVEYPACPLNGQAKTSCKAPANNLLYSEAYGGRAQECPLNTIVGYKCFVKDPNLAVFSIASCKEDPEKDAAINNFACFPTKVGNWVYSAPYGGRDKNCEDNNSGNCFFQYSTKAQSALNLLPENVKAGEKIFGTMGTFITEGFYWGSGAHRDPGGKRMVYQKPPGPAPNPAPYIEAEANFDPTSATLPANYRFVPKISSDTEAIIGAQKVDRTGWNLKECGLDVSGDTRPVLTVLDKRIANCANVFGSSATWDGVTKGNAGQGVWQLAARKILEGQAYEVWLDTATDLLWSSKVSPITGLNWCKATGNSFSLRIDEKMRENDANGICNSSQYQSTGNNHPISACIEGFSGYLTDDSSLANGFMSTGTEQRGKAGLVTLPPAQRSLGRVFWRLPTMYDFILANHNGLRYVLPDVGGTEEWTATTYSNDRSKAWTYDTTKGVRRVQPKTYGYSVRCVGR